jgi:adenylate kinase
MPYVGVGDILRQEIAAKTLLGVSIKALLEKGHFVGDDIINEMMQKALSGHQDYILDGYPRNIDQAEFYLSEIHHPSFVIHLVAPEAVLVKRMLARGRDDDTEETIKARMEKYEQDTSPVLDYLAIQSSFVTLEIEGFGGIEVVARRVRDAIMDYLDQNDGFYP